MSLSTQSLRYNNGFTMSITRNLTLLSLLVVGVSTLKNSLLKFPNLTSLRNADMLNHQKCLNIAILKATDKI